MSVVVIYKFHVFDDAFFLLAIVAMIAEKNVFFLFLWQPLLGENPFIKLCSFSRLFLKIMESDR